MPSYRDRLDPLSPLENPPEDYDVTELDAGEWYAAAVAAVSGDSTSCEHCGLGDGSVSVGTYGAICDACLDLYPLVDEDEPDEDEPDEDEPDEDTCEHFGYEHCDCPCVCVRLVCFRGVHSTTLPYPDFHTLGSTS